MCVHSNRGFAQNQDGQKCHRYDALHISYGPVLRMPEALVWQPPPLGAPPPGCGSTSLIFFICQVRAANLCCPPAGRLRCAHLLPARELSILPGHSLVTAWHLISYKPFLDEPYPASAHLGPGCHPPGLGSPLFRDLEVPARSRAILCVLYCFRSSIGSTHVSLHTSSSSGGISAPQTYSATWLCAVWIDLHVHYRLLLTFQNLYASQTGPLTLLWHILKVK